MVGGVERWSVKEVNKNGEQLEDACAERGLFSANTFPQQKIIHISVWRRVKGVSKSVRLVTQHKMKVRKDVLELR